MKIEELEKYRLELNKRINSIQLNKSESNPEALAAISKAIETIIYLDRCISNHNASEYDKQTCRFNKRLTKNEK